MATANITMNACTGASDSMKVYYGKTLLVTGTPLSGTGWTLHTGSPLSAGTTSVTITGLDDNVQYTVYRYCHCPSGDTDAEIDGPEIKYVCPTFQTTNSSSTQIDYTISIPSSANNTGTWINKILVEVYDSTGTTLFSSNTHNSPFSSTASGSFLGLNPSTTYRVKIKYSNSSGTITHDCGFQDIATQAPCVAPTVTITNITSNSFEVNWTVPASFVGDSYSIILNSSTIASGLSIGSSPYLVTGLSGNTLYSVQVVRNCGFGGTATSSSVNATTTAPETSIDWDFFEEVSSNGSLIIRVNGVNQVNVSSSQFGDLLIGGGNNIQVTANGVGGATVGLSITDETAGVTIYSNSGPGPLNSTFTSISGHTYSVIASTSV